jgi:hypothetical protein
MSLSPPENKPQRSDQNAWAGPVKKVKVSGAPADAMNLNVEGRQLNSPNQGFGQMWQKTFKINLPGVKLTPVELMELWKANFQAFQPPENTFYPTMAGIQPGEVLLIEAKVPPLPGMPSILPVATGVLVMYADETSFTVMTPEGHPESGWNTFSVYEEDEIIVAQAQSLGRPTDPMYEFFMRVLGSGTQQDKIWIHMLEQLAAHFQVKGEVTLTKVLVDPKIQWSQAKNIWKNAAIRTVFYFIGAPFRWLLRPFKAQSRS